MSLENFPTNQTAKRMLDTVTHGWYDNSYIGKWIFQVLGMEMEDARNLIYELQQQPFPELATWGIGYHESKFGIVPKPDETIEDRRRNLLYRRDSRVPLNPARIEKMLSTIIGKKVSIHENIGQYTFIVECDFQDDFSNWEEAYKELNVIKPSHLSFLFGFLFSVYQKNHIKVRNINRIKFYWWGGLLDGSFLLDGSKNLSANQLFQTINIHRMCFLQKEGIHCESVTVKEHYWILNGDYLLNGEKTMQALERKEEI